MRQGVFFDTQQHTNEVMMNQKKSRKQLLFDFHEKLSRDNIKYQLAVLYDPNIKEYNKAQVNNIIKRHRRRLDFWTKKKIIEARFEYFGSLQEKEELPTFKYIGQLLQVKERTVNSVVNRYKKLNGKLYPNPMNYQNKQLTNYEFTKLNKQELDFILKPETLREWVAFSLSKRCTLIKEKFNKQISRVTLAKYYKRNKIRHAKPEYDKQIHQNRLLFVQQILEYYRQNAEIIYVDESTTNLWQKPGRLWISKEHPFKIKLATNRGEGVTIIGAITSKRSKLIYFLCDGSTLANLEIFFLGLHQIINLQDKVVVLDNLAAHQNEEFRIKIQSFGAKILFLPVATSFFNPIETVWAWIKGKWRNHLLDPTLNQPNTEYLIKTLAEICDNIPNPIIQNIRGHTFKIIRDYMIKSGIFSNA